MTRSQPAPPIPSLRDNTVLLVAWAAPMLTGSLAAAGVLPVALAGPLGLAGLLTVLCLAGANRG